MTAIEWTDRTWNPTTGCSKVSPGCAHCYAETLSLRFGWSKKPWTPENAAENVVLHPERLNKPLSWRKPSMVFVNSMSDLFHELIPDSFICDVFDVMARCPQHTFQVLTKRPERARDFFAALDHHVKIYGTPEHAPVKTGWYRSWPLPNVWIGTSIENVRYVGRADVLRDTPAAVRFISAEPLLGSLYVDDGKTYRWLNLDRIDWLIVGGESGQHHRPVDAQWVRDLRDEALNANTAFFFKQWGGRTPKSNGRILDGREWSEYPT